jgi:hypothetical protein
MHAEGFNVIVIESLKTCMKFQMIGTILAQHLAHWGLAICGSYKLVAPLVRQTAKIGQ